MEGVAVIGLACRFPSAADLAAYWKLLEHGVDAITEVPSSRWDIDEYYSPKPELPGMMITRWGGFLDRIDAFDAGFFGISAAEAERIDPQQRLMLEVCWEAVEDAGLAASRLRGSETGVFVGVSHSDYDRLIYRERYAINGFNGTGSYHSIVANRVSYTFDLKGPSLVVDSACSSSLAALHLGCRALRDGECDTAIVGGVNLNVTPDELIALSKTGLLSRTGRCRVFDAGADGYVRGEGCGVLILQLLNVARRDNRRLRAVIRGSAMGQDGLTNGLAAPNGIAQQSVMRRALRDAGTDPAEVSLIEAHAVGTPLGDAVEFKSIQSVYGAGRGPDNKCRLGSVKGNIGHLEAASGIAGTIKLILALEKQTIPPQINFTEPHPYIPLDESTFEIRTESTPWAPASGVRVAAINAFGFGGTNCHAILQQAPAYRLATPPARWWGMPAFLPLSAKSPSALRDLALRYAIFLEESPDASLLEMCRAVALERTHFPCRRTFDAADRNALVADLRRYAADTSLLAPRPVRLFPKATWFFRRDGSESHSVARELHKVDQGFRDLWNACDRHSVLEHPCITELDGGAAIDAETSAAPLADAIALLAIQIRLFDIWNEWGIRSQFGRAEGLGKFAAECCMRQVRLEEVLQQLSRECVAFSGQRVDPPPALAERDQESGRSKPVPPPDETREHGVLIELRADAELRDLLLYGYRNDPAGASNVPPHTMPATFADPLAALYVSGANIRWDAVYGSSHHSSLSLPGYPFQRRRYWYE